jgi:hypothetical protein
MEKKVFQFIANSDLVRFHCIISIAWGEGGGQNVDGGTSLCPSVSSVLARFGTLLLVFILLYIIFRPFCGTICSSRLLQPHGIPGFWRDSNL